MKRTQLMELAESKLGTVTQVRHQLSTARMGRAAHAVMAAEQRAKQLAAQLSGLNDEMRRVREACMRAVTGNIGGAAMYQVVLRALDAEARRTYVRMDMQEEECGELRYELTLAKKKVESLETRLDLYRKAERRAKAMREDMVDEAYLD
jgi:hypothetical protein